MFKEATLEDLVFAVVGRRGAAGLGFEVWGLELDYSLCWADGLADLGRAPVGGLDALFRGSSFMLLKFSLFKFSCC